MHRCPHCREYQIRRAHRRFFDLPFRLFGFVPFRCLSCGTRFFGQRPPERTS